MPSRSPLSGEGVGVASREDILSCIIGKSGGGEEGVRFRLMILLGLLRLPSSSSEHGLDRNILLNDDRVHVVRILFFRPAPSRIGLPVC